MKTVGDLLHSLARDEVLAAVARLYSGYTGEDPEGYRNAWTQLLALQPSPTKFSVVLARSWSIDEPPVACVDVSGRMEGDPAGYAIEFEDWREWLSMPIVVDAELGEVSEVEMLAHCLCEMTCPGYEYGAAQDGKADFRRTIQDIKDKRAEQASEGGPPVLQ